MLAVVFLSKPMWHLSIQEAKKTESCTLTAIYRFRRYIRCLGKEGNTGSDLTLGAQRVKIRYIVDFFSCWHEQSRAKTNAEHSGNPSYFCLNAAFLNVLIICSVNACFQ